MRSSTVLRSGTGEEVLQVPSRPTVPCLQCLVQLYWLVLTSNIVLVQVLPVLVTATTSGTCTGIVLLLYCSTASGKSTSTSTSTSTDSTATTGSSSSTVVLYYQSSHHSKSVSQRRCHDLLIAF